MKLFILHFFAMKRLLFGLFLSLTLFFGSSLLTAQAAELFPDISGDELREAVSLLAEQGVLKGYADGTFGPERTITRAEALKMIFLVHGTELQTNGKQDFSDVKASDWFEPYVRQAAFDKVVQGYPDGSFKPGQDVSRAEFLKMLFVADPSYVPNLPHLQLEAAEAVSDLGRNDWFLGYASRVWEWDLLDLSNGLRPHEGMTRADAALLLYRLQEYQKTMVKQLQEAANSTGCSMCVNGVDWSQYPWAHWEAVSIAHGEITIGWQEHLEERLALGEIGEIYLEDVAHFHQYNWLVDNTPKSVKHRFAEDFPEHYAKGMGLNGGTTRTKDMKYFSGYGYDVPNPIRTIDGERLDSKIVDTSFEVHLIHVFNHDKSLNPDKLDFHDWKKTQRGLEGMYDALLHTNYFPDHASFR